MNKEIEITLTVKQLKFIKEVLNYEKDQDNAFSPISCEGAIKNEEQACELAEKIIKRISVFLLID